jgi:hypothetical protein
VDEIVICNGGWNFPEYTNDDTPLQEVSEVIKRLDVNGKIHEIRGLSWDKLKQIHDRTSEKYPVQKTGNRAKAATLANEAAGELGADWVLWIASDQVFYANAKQLRALTENTSGTDGFQFYEHKEFWGSQWFWLKPEFCTDPYSTNDGAKFYKYGGNGGQVQWFCGEGGIMNYRNQTADDTCTTGHFRECYPADRDCLPVASLYLSDRIQRSMFYWIDHSKCEGFTITKLEAFRRAVADACSVWDRAQPKNLNPASYFAIPQVFFAKSPEQYILDGMPK